MFDHFQICPYTGLRSFTEEESLYFKGRDSDIDQATIQLQRNKFLMLTGASGDGKSSLVYAGIIPNARAGFLKSKYSQWCVANFRPERAPFKNLCRTLSKELTIANPDTVQGELNHGFSALADLYKNSKRYIDLHSFAWQQADEKERSAMKREAANLIVLVDQFEEFFTNPENYQQGVPSRDASLVLNLLLETARIALEEDLPIYVIFTMRSDYIGQCAAFRGLPEYIGFSQFFVPRLNRTQLQHVIEEPASLSGNRIARRLTERLIYDITEGVDQLPILQHALNQIWLAADHGKEEMDLLHYAMVGGIGVNELPGEQVPLFNEWFETLPPEIKACYHAPTLQNVLDTHTNKLYEQAAGYFSEKTGKSISTAEAKSIIRIAFTCLTKIDQGRAVRNRMTLQEITHIAGDPHFDTAAIGILLNIFREPGNTFIHPFITGDDAESRVMVPETVLDITHESLIRNWQLLGSWAREEYESYSISLDFEKQLERWISSNRSPNFLLAIGPLTYFETWFNKARPNAFWIARYLPEKTSTEKRLANATEILGHSTQFLKKSARSHVITRTVMRYGPRRIAIAVTLLAFLTFTSFAVKDYITRQNGYVLADVRQRALQIANDTRANAGSKTSLLIEELKTGRVTIDEIANAVTDTIQKIKTINNVASMLILTARDEPRTLIYRSLYIVDSLLEPLVVPLNDPAKLSAGLKEINLYRVTLEMAYLYSHDARFATLKKQNALRSAHWVLKILDGQPAGFDDLQNLNLALENGINYQCFTGEQLQQLLSLLSPFENGLQNSWLRSNFNRDKLLIRGSVAQNYGFTHNGLYQELAYLYAGTGNAAKALQCIDTLLAHSQNNFQNDYSGGMDNATNIAGVFVQYNQLNQLDDFVSGYCIRKKIDAEEFYARLLGRTVRANSTLGNMRLLSFMDEFQNLNLQFLDWKQLGFFYDKYRAVVRATIKDPTENKFLAAVSYKNEAIEKSLSNELPPPGETTVDGLFDKAVTLYQTIDPQFLDVAIPMIDLTGNDRLMLPRKFLFVYPDIRTVFHPEEPRSFYLFYFDDVYMNYILDHNLFTRFYPGAVELDYVADWLYSNHVKGFAITAFCAADIHYDVLKKLTQEIQKHPSRPGVDFNVLYLLGGFTARQTGDTVTMLKLYDQLEPGNIFNLLRSKEFGGNVNDFTLRQIATGMLGYFETGQYDKMVQLARMFKNPVNRSSLYAYTAVQLLQQKRDPHSVASLIDSAKTEMNRVENTTGEQPNRRLLAYALMMQDRHRNEQEAYSVIRNLPAKFKATQNICRSFAYYGDLYESQSRIPGGISSTDQADFLTANLIGYANGNSVTDSSWQLYSNNNFFNRIQAIQYIDEDH